MPFISIHTAQKLSNDQKETIKGKIGESIRIIPNKREEVLMIEFIDGVTMYFAGKEKTSSAYIDVRCYKEADFESNKAFTESMNKIMEDEAGIPNTALYLTILEYANWGTKGSLK